MKIEKRKDPLKLVRAAKKVPGVLYGKSISPVSIQIDEVDLHDLIKEYGYTKTFKLTLGKTSHQVYIKDIQFDAIKRTYALNVKLQKVTEGDTIRASVPLNILGKEIVEKPGVLINIIVDSIDVEYPVGKGLTHIDLDISDKTVGDTVHMKDLVLPDYLNIHDDMDKLLISISEVTYQEEVEEGEETEETVEVETEETTDSVE
ncbi:MAG: 50S ribosomal protein L25 [Bacilli bacterium]|nr:50S ribosomal protein L25 [Bacilli bacterium]MBN2876705.1 50S ribosomal protein L25 [Bacilli bacterium]